MPQTDSPATGFRPFFNPATGEWITYTALAEDNGGQLVRFTWRSVPGGVITEHIHPHQEERFTILAGQARFTLAGEELLAEPARRSSCPPACRTRRETPDQPRSTAWSSSARPCTPRSGTRPSPAWSPTARPHPGARRATRSSSAPPSGTSATKAGSPHRPSGCRTSCSPRSGHWPRPSAYAPTTSAGTAASQTPAHATRNYPAPASGNHPRPTAKGHQVRPGTGITSPQG